MCVSRVLHFKYFSLKKHEPFSYSNQCANIIPSSAPDDYVAVSRELTFSAGERRDCFEVTLNTDDELEDDEQFRLQLSTNEERVDFDPETTTVDIIDESEKKTKLMFLE